MAQALCMGMFFAKSAIWKNKTRSCPPEGLELSSKCLFLPWDRTHCSYSHCSQNNEVLKNEFRQERQGELGGGILHTFKSCPEPTKGRKFGAGAPTCSQTWRKQALGSRRVNCPLGFPGFLPQFAAGSTWLRWARWEEMTMGSGCFPLLSLPKNREVPSGLKVPLSCGCAQGAEGLMLRCLDHWCDGSSGRYKP